MESLLVRAIANTQLGFHRLSGINSPGPVQDTRRPFALAPRAVVNSSPASHYRGSKDANTHQEFIAALASKVWHSYCTSVDDTAIAAAYRRMSQAFLELHLSKEELGELHGLRAALCRLLGRRGTHLSTLLWSSSRSEILSPFQ